MNPNQYQLSMRHAFDPWKTVTLSNILDDLFKGAAVAAVHIAATDDPFANGWNAAARYMENKLSALAPLPLPTNVIFNDPATIVYWNDGTKTVVKCQPGDVFSAETGLTTAMLKKYMGNDNTFNRVINEWLKRTGQYKPSAIPTLPAPDCAETPIAESTE